VARDRGHSERVSEQLDTWGDFRLGDRVCFIRIQMAFVPSGRQYDLVELWSTTDPISGEPDALAVIRGEHGETMTVSVRTLRRL
jgi:hypothetical protein